MGKGEDDKMPEEWFEIATKNSLGMLFDKIVERSPHKEALIFKDQRLSYGQLQDRMNTFARGLLKLGVKKGDHIAIWMTSKPEWIYAQYAALKIGGSVVTVNTRFKASEAEYVIRQSDSNTLIFEERFIGKIDALEMINQLVPELHSCEPGKLMSGKMPQLKNVICLSEQKHPGMFSYKEVMQLGEDRALDKVLAAAVAATSPAM